MFLICFIRINNSFQLSHIKIKKREFYNQKKNKKNKLKTLYKNFKIYITYHKK